MTASPRRRGLVAVAIERASRVVAEYVRFRHTGGMVELYRHLRGLPRQESRIVSVGLGGAALVVLATPALAGLASGLGPAVFEDARGTTQTIAPAALWLALAAFSLAWGYILTGAALGPEALWIVTGLVYVFLTVHVGLAIGRSYLHIPALVLPVLVRAVTPARRAWSNVILALLLASVAVRLLPLPEGLRAYWYLVWLPAGGVGLGLHCGFSRRPWPSASQRAALAATVTGLYFLAVGVLAPTPGHVAGAFNLSLNLAIGLFALLWFLLGASFVSGAIALGRFVHRIVDVLVPTALPRWMLPLPGVLLILWVTRFPTEGVIPARPWAAGVLAVMAVALAVRWRTGGTSHQWLAGWLIITIAVLAVVRAYATLDIGDVLTREAGALSLVAFAYAIIWEVTGHLPKVPLAARDLAPPAPVLLYLGLVLLISAATLFGLAANSQYFQEVVVLQQYRGASSLWIPIGLLVVLRAWPGLERSVPEVAVRAFLLGAALAVAVFMLLASGVPGWGAIAILAGMAAIVAGLVWREPCARSLITAAAVGIGLALGFAVSLSQRVLVDLLPPLLGIPGVLFGIPALRSVAVTVRDWSDGAVWRPADQITYYALAPVLAMGAAVIAAWLRDRAWPSLHDGRPTADRP